MQSPGTRFKWYDQSQITPVIEDPTVKPLFIATAATDKGPEDLREVVGDEFYKDYGSTVDFNKYGHAILNAARIINAGGRLLFKRLVADDATLANIIVIMNITSKSEQKTNAAGELLYVDATSGEETTTADGNEPLMLNKASISYDCQSVASVKTMDEVKTAALAMVDEDGTEEDGNTTYSIPLFCITDVGRGTSSKRFSITPNYAVSKSMNYMMYKFNVIGEYKDLDTEYCNFALDDDMVYLNSSQSLTMSAQSLRQMNVYAIPHAGVKAMEIIANITGDDYSTIVSEDVLFGCNLKGFKVDNIEVDTESGYDLQSSLGIELLSGTNGSFTTNPVGTEEYNKQLLSFWDGSFTDDIYDVDRWKIYACIDANYPYNIKNAIIDLADFREDFFFFADLTTDCINYSLVANAAASIKASKFCAIYTQNFDVIDEFSRKQITVTGTYPMSKKMVNHFLDQPGVPTCGIAHGFVFDEVINDTVSFIPKYTPKYDQKTELCESYLNYGTYLNGVYTLETEYTHQEPYTELTYINNILAVQQLIRAIRTQCPKDRYTFITNDDLSTYQKSVENVLSLYVDLFDSLKFEYVQDEIMRANKIFEANISVKFKDFVQSELFNIYTLSQNS